jgi:hypothetical protein
VLEDHGFWMNLETELGAQVGPAWQEFVQRRQEFLDLEQSIVIAGAQMNETDAVVLITELEAAIGSFVATAGNINAASHIIQTAAFRTRFETLNNSVCSAGIAHLQEKNQPQGSALRRMASAVFRARKAVGGIGLMGLNSAVGAGAITLPFVIPVAAGIVPGSLVGGLAMLLSWEHLA